MRAHYRRELLVLLFARSFSAIVTFVYGTGFQLALLHHDRFSTLRQLYRNCYEYKACF